MRKMHRLKINTKFQRYIAYSFEDLKKSAVLTANLYHLFLVISKKTQDNKNKETKELKLKI